MASAVATNRLACRRKVEMWFHNPVGTGAEAVTPDGGTTKRYVAMRDYASFQAIAMLALKTGNGITLLEIVAATDAAGTNATRIKTSGAIACAAVGDWAMQECTAEEINHVGKAAGHNFTHVAARLTSQNLGDHSVVTYIRDEPRFPQDGLTPATTIA